MNTVHEKVTRQLYYGLILLMITAIIMYSSYLVSALIDRNKSTSLANVNSTEWTAVKAILDEEITKGALSSDHVANNIKEDVLTTYPDKSNLEYDLQNISPDSKLFTVFNQNVKGVYLNGVENDNNDIFILSPKLGIIFDLSKNCAIGEYPKTVEKEISIQNNQVLANLALNAILSQSTTKYIFWNYLYTPDKYSYVKEIDTMSIDTLKSVYDKYGLDGLAYFEFLSSTPIDQYEDILGVPDVSNVGARNSNDKLFVVQGFNLQDAIDTNHPSFELYYDNLRSGIERTYDLEKTVVFCITVPIYLGLMTAFISLIRSVNKAVL